MTRKAALVKRMRRKLWGGRLDIRFYADGSSHVRADHPSNDPEIELAMAGASLKVMQAAYDKAGLAYDVGCIKWHDDP